MKPSGVIIAIVSALVMIIGVGCMTGAKWLTPAEVDPAAVQYVAATGVANPEAFKSFLYPNQKDVERLDKYMDYAHSTIQLKLAQTSEFDNLDYTTLKESVAAAKIQAAQTNDILFGETGLVASLLGLAGIGIGGVFIKRPGDVSQSEVKKTTEKLEKVEGGSKAIYRVIEKLKVLHPEIWENELKPIAIAEAKAAGNVTMPDQV